jgi:uncharacterized protein YhfF
MARREGEDKSLEEWRTGHIGFFLRDAERDDYTFTEDMPVVFEDFAVVKGEPAQIGKIQDYAPE